MDWAEGRWESKQMDWEKEEKNIKRWTREKKGGKVRRRSWEKERGNCKRWTEKKEGGRDGLGRRKEGQ